MGNKQVHYFKICAETSDKVLDASKMHDGECCLWEDNNEDSQLWFWDGPQGDILRNKEFPDRVLDFCFADYEKENWGKVRLTNDCHDGWNQRFHMDQCEIFCKGSTCKTISNLCLDVAEGGDHNGAKVGVCEKNGGQNQCWRLEEKDDKEYFYICETQCGKALEASMTMEGEVFLWENTCKDNQMWFWDCHGFLRNKQFPTKVLDFNWADYQEHCWGKVFLNELNHGCNQKWNFHGKDIVCKGHKQEIVENLRLDVCHGKTCDGAKVGVSKRNCGCNQQWEIKECEE